MCPGATGLGEGKDGGPETIWDLEDAPCEPLAHPVIQWSKTGPDTNEDSGGGIPSLGVSGRLRDMATWVCRLNGGGKPPYANLCPKLRAPQR